MDTIKVLDRHVIFRQVLFAVAGLLCLTPLVSAPMALVLGLLIALFVGHPFLHLNHKATHLLLQVSVVGLGFGINAATALKAGREGFLFTVASIFGTLAFGLLLGRWMKIDRKTSLLISGGVLLALAVCLHLFFFSRGFYSIGWDESGRTLDAYEWAAHGTVLSRAWLPFYRISVGLGLKVFPDLFLTPRILTFLFGLATIPAAAWLAHELFQSRKTTQLTLTLSTFFSQRLALSLAPLSDIMFIFVSLVTIALFTRWLRTYGRSALLLSALFCALGSTLRFEGWIFGGAIFLARSRRF